MAQLCPMTGVVGVSSARIRGLSQVSYGWHWPWPVLEVPLRFVQPSDWLRFTLFLAPAIDTSLGPYAATMLAPTCALPSPLWLPSSKPLWARMPLLACPRLAAALHASQPHAPACVPEPRTATACPPDPLRHLD
ncbi:hypothetical protein V6N13_048471 [Hibiscus sabdariffa]